MTTYGEIIRDRINCSKGEWVANGKVMNGALMKVIISEVRVGFLRLVKGEKPISNMVYCETGEAPPLRDDVGDLDESAWPLDQLGKRRDPQVYGFLVVFEAEDGTEYEWLASSWYAQKVVNALLYKAKRARGATPVVRLEADSVQHAKFGKTPTPKLAIVGFADQAPTMPALAGPSRGSSVSLAPAGNVVPLIDDDIPF